MKNLLKIILATGIILGSCGCLVPDKDTKEYRMMSSKEFFYHCGVDTGFDKKDYEDKPRNTQN